MSIELKDTGITEMDFTGGEEAMFWESVRQLARYGVPSHDKQGHWAEVRVRVRPLQLDMVSAIKEKMPEGWFKNTACLYRSIIAVGCKTILKLLDEEHGEWDQVLTGLNQIAKKTRLEKFRQEMAALRSDIINGNMPADEKVKVVDLMGRLEKKMMGM